MRRWLIQLRKEKQYTQQQIAAGAHIDRAYYAQIENGTRNPSMSVATKIASFLHINPSLFFSDHLSEPFEVVLTHSPIVLAHCDLELRYTWLFHPNPEFEISHLIGKRDDELSTDDGMISLMKFKEKIIETEERTRQNISFQFCEEFISYDVFGQPLYDTKGTIIGVATASTKLRS